MKKIKGVVIIAIIILSIISALPIKVSAQAPYQYHWSMDRPGKDISFNSTDYNVDPPERVEQYNTSDYASVGLGVEIWKYHEQGYEGNRDGVSLRPMVTANTRKNIQYMTTKYDHLTDWYNPLDLTDTGIVGNDDGVWIDIPFPVRFYGGPGAQNTSFTASKVWVCSNGFLCFTSESTNPNPQFLPDPDEPNGLIAVYWTDLTPLGGGKITYWNQSSDYFVVAWYNVLNMGSLQRETFEVIIENQRLGGYPAPYADARGQNKIKFLYQNTSDEAVAGVENQEGSVGTIVSGPLNGKSVWLFPDVPSPEIRELSIIASKQDSDAEIYVSTSHNILRGHNMDWLEEAEDPSLAYEKAMMGSATLLMTKGVGALNPLAGISLSTILITLEFVSLAAKATWPSNYLDVEDADYAENTAYIKASAAYNPAYPRGDGHWPVDAWLATTIDWVFKDATGLSHSVDLWGRLVYYVDGLGNQTIETTPVTIEMTPDIGQTIGTAKSVSAGIYYGCLDSTDRGDLYSFSVSADHVINVSMTPPGDANYDLDLYDPNGVYKNSSTNGGNSTENIVFLAQTGGSWYLNVTYTDWPGHTMDGAYRLIINDPYSAPVLHVRTKTLTGQTIPDVDIKIDSVWYTSPVDEPVLPGSHTIRADTYFRRGDYVYYFRRWHETGQTTAQITVNVQSDTTRTALYEKQYDPPGGGGCPYVYTWNGSAYVLDNNVLGMSEVSNGSYVEDFYRLEQTLIPTYQGRWFSRYSLMLSEFENEHSYIDKVRLYAVDHDQNVNVALTPEGQILTYSNPNPPVSAIDNHANDWLPSLLEADDIYYLGFPEDYLLLDFGSLDISQGAKLVLRANIEWKKDTCINVQVLNETGGWTAVAALRTRNNWSTIIVDLADYLPNPDGTLKIRLCLTGIHKIDYVGLDTTPQADYELHYAPLVSAIHSVEGNVRWKLLFSDDIYAEFIPDQQIELKFTLLNNSEEARTFIIRTEGHYETIS